MIDTNILLRKWISSSVAVMGALGPGGSVFCGSMPKGFDPTQAMGVQISNMGGTTHPEITGIVQDKKQVRVWGDVEEGDAARQAYGAIRDLIHGATNVVIPGSGYVMSCLEVMPSQDVTDPDTGWETVLGFFKLTARNL